MLEILVHGLHESDLHSYEIVCVTFAPSLVLTPPLRDLPRSWSDPAPSLATQHFGDAWIKSNKSPVLRLPSSVNPLEFNYLLNPSHRHWKKLRLGKPQSWPFDVRFAN